MGAPAIFPRFLIFTSVFGALALFCIDVRGDQNYSALIWPAGGVLLGTLLTTSRREWPLWLVTAALIHFAVGMYIARPVVVSVTYALQEAVEMAAIGLAWTARVPSPRVLTGARDLGRFVAYSTLSIVLCGSLAALALQALGIPAAQRTWVTVWLPDLCGALFAAPLVIAWTRPESTSLTEQPRRAPFGWLAMRDFMIGLAAMLGLIGSTIMVFDSPLSNMLFESGNSGLSYLPPLFLMVVAFKWEQRGLTLAMVVFATLAILITLQGEGPFAVSQPLSGTALVELQSYLCEVAVAALLVAVIAHTRKAARREANAWKSRFYAVIQGGTHVVYDYDAATQRIRWSANAQALLGVHPDELGNPTRCLARVHPADRSRVERLVRAKIAGLDQARDNPMARRFEFLCGDNSYRSLEDIFTSTIDGQDSGARINGLLRLDL